MHKVDIRSMSTAQLSEESFIDLAFAILTNKKETLTLQQLGKEIQALNGFSDEQVASHMLQFYTDMNVDGRFLAIEGNRWGLREWYPVDQIEEETAPTVKVRKKKAKSSDEDGLEELDDELGFDEEYDEYEELEVELGEEEEEEEEVDVFGLTPIEDEVELVEEDDELLVPEEDELSLDEDVEDLDDEE